VVVAAQAVIDGNGNGIVEPFEVVGEQRGVAVVWRDPYPADQTAYVGDYNYEYPFARFFKYLTE
jgi:hypothetical protein